MVLYLLATVRGQVESENCEERDTHTGYDDVNGVEQCLAPHRDVERNVKVRLVAASVEPLVPIRNHNVRLYYTTYSSNCSKYPHGRGKVLYIYIVNHIYI